MIKKKKAVASARKRMGADTKQPGILEVLKKKSINTDANLEGTERAARPDQATTTGNGPSKGPLETLGQSNGSPCPELP